MGGSCTTRRYRFGRWRRDRGGCGTGAVSVTAPRGRFLTPHQEQHHQNSGADGGRCVYRLLQHVPEPTTTSVEPETWNRPRREAKLHERVLAWRAPSAAMPSTHRGTPLAGIAGQREERGFDAAALPLGTASLGHSSAGSAAGRGF